MKHFDWLIIVIGLGTSNQSTLFHCSLPTLLSNLFITFGAGIFKGPLVIFVLHSFTKALEQSTHTLTTVI